MPISNVEEKEYCKVEVCFQAEPEKVVSKRNEVTDKLFKEVSKTGMAGYRKGKAPISAVKSRYRKQIESETERELQALAYDEIIFETKMKTIFYPQIIKSVLDNSKFQIRMLFMKKPTFELKQYKGFEIPKPHVGISAPDLVEQMIQQMRMENGDVVPFSDTDFIQKSDKVTLDVKCTVESKVDENLSSDGMLYNVGDNFYPGFDDNIQGMAVGEERTFDLLWDDATQKRATFVVKFNMGVKTVPCALDDEFAKKIGLESYAQLRERVEGAAGSRIKASEMKLIAQQIVARLVTEHDFEVPGWLTLLEAKQLAAKHQLVWNDLEEDTRTKITSLAQEQVKISLIMDSIRDAEPDTQLSEKEMLEIIRQRVAQLGQDPEQYLVESQRSGRLFGVVAALQHEATLQWLVDQSKIVE